MRAGRRRRGIAGLCRAGQPYHCDQQQEQQCRRVEDVVGRELRRDLHYVTVDVGVVGRLDIAQGNRPIRAVRDANRGKRADDDGEPALALCLRYRAQAKLGCRCS
jgi:hypothetical protein